MAEAVLQIVVGRLNDLLNEEAEPLNRVREEIQQVVSELMRMKTFLRDADSRINEQRVGILVAQVRDLVYDAEDVVESFLLKAISSERRKTKGGIKNLVKRWVCVIDDYVYHHKFSRGIKHIQTRIQNLYRCFRDYDIISTVEEDNETSSSETQPGKLKRFYSYSVVEPDLFVGFQGDVKSLVGHLVDESDDCYPVIFIAGMGGLGKTTLARKIYNHSTIKKHFSGLAWVSISQKWQAKAVLQRILISLVHEKKEEILCMEDGKLVENLLEVQRTKNCLIVLDDIWSNDAWDSLKAAFPTENSGNKLLLTSRNLEVADHVSLKCFIHKPQLLDAEQSWELLWLKAFPKGNYLDTKDVKKMEEFGREMVQTCAGLPLAIVVLGGILVTKPSFIEWEKVYNDSRSSLKRGKGLGEDHQREVFEILVWSYNVLPTQLKPCFLYLGKFGEDEEIDAETLYQMWIAEGMVLSSDKSGDETMMEVAESYMGELVYKSMVQVKYEDEVNPQRKFKSFMLHDLMKDLSLSIAERQDFFTVADVKNVADFHFNTSVVQTPSTRHLVLYFDAGSYKSIKDNPFFVNQAYQRRLRSVLLFDNVSGRKSLPQILGSHVSKFRLLRVFALEGVGVTVDNKSVSDRLQKVLSSLVYLRYLSLHGTSWGIFSSIQKLELLKTLKLDTCHFMFPVHLTDILSKLGCLQHLYLPNLHYRSKVRNHKLRFNGLSKLETLENFDTKWCEVKDLPNLISLQKLLLNVDGSSHDVEALIKYLLSLSRLRYLILSITICDSWSKSGPDMWRQLFGNHKLNSQELMIYSLLPELTQIFGQQQLDDTYIDVSLIRITKLHLWESYLEEDPMPILEKIPTLRLLRLGTKSYVGKEMVCAATGFPKLTTLFLKQLTNLVKWRVEEGSMPILSNLCIDDCAKLEELPEGLRFLDSLQTVSLYYMSCDRVRVVNGEQQGPDSYKIAHVPNLKIIN